jgi:hypothetical protein
MENNNDFIKCLKLLIGERSIRETARDTKVASSYICMMLKGNYIPSAKIIIKLTDKKNHPRNKITKEKMMKSVGYL